MVFGLCVAMLGPIGPIQMHNSVLNPHLIDNSIAADYDNIAFSVPHLYYNPRHIKQEVVSESDCQPSVPQNCHFPFFNKNRMSYDSNRILNSSANSMYSVKVCHSILYPLHPLHPLSSSLPLRSLICVNFNFDPMSGLMLIVWTYI